MAEVQKMRETTNQAKLKRVYEILQKKGYRPIDQIVGFLLTDDPTYITSADGARTLVADMDQDALLREIIRYYFDNPPQC